MSQLNRNPNECRSVSELRQWVADLQTQCKCLQNTNRANLSLIKTLRLISQERGQQIDALKRQVELLKQANLHCEQLLSYKSHSIRQN